MTDSLDIIIGELRMWANDSAYARVSERLDRYADRLERISARLRERIEPQTEEEIQSRGDVKC